MTVSLSPLALANREALAALSATITEGAQAFAADLADPVNATEDSLTGDELLGFLQAVIMVCGTWRALAENLVTKQPEFQEWRAAQDLAGDLKPGLND